MELNKKSSHIPKKEGEYDLKMLTDMLMRLKAQYPEKEDASILMEPDIAYDYLIQIMDTVRGTEIKAEESEAVQKMVLFPQISIGDAP